MAKVKIGVSQARALGNPRKVSGATAVDDIAPYNILLRCPALKLNMQLLLDEEEPRLVGGLGGYTSQERSGDIAISRWAGMDMLKMDVYVLLDGFKKRENQQQRYANIKQLARNAKDPGIQPPPFVLEGPLPVSGQEWVLESLEEGETKRSKGGVLLRKALVLHCQEWVPPDQLKIYEKKRKRKKKGKDSGIPGPLLTKYTVKNGDTLRTIAAHFYHDGDEWVVIAKANDIRDPNSIKPGQVLKIPEQ